ncbi:hypothetical protein [Microbacterium panaciterrae]|uniref:HNH endonuclease n=1 Tax=Microbacterium panaciterrae TaxID=985759 RepID=A0ABP8P635_9MICO
MARLKPEEQDLSRTARFWRDLKHRPIPDGEPVNYDPETGEIRPWNPNPWYVAIRDRHRAWGKARFGDDWTPQHVRERAVMIRAGFLCEHSGCTTEAHIVRPLTPYEIGGYGTDNLMALCRSHEGMAGV